MPDITSISTALASLKTASDLAKLIKNSDITLKDAEVKLQLAELIESLADTKIELSEIQILLQSKLREIEELKEKLEIKKDMTWDPPYYWVGPKNDGNGPYCQNCYDDKSKLIRLQEHRTGYWGCMTCDNGYKDSTYESPKPIVGKRRSIWDTGI